MFYILNMRRFLFLVLISGFSLLQTYAQNAVKNFQQVEKEMTELKQDNAKLKTIVDEMAHMTHSMQLDIDSLKSLTREQANDIKTLSSRQDNKIKRIEGQIKETKGDIEQNKSILGQRTVWGVISACFLLALIGLAVYLLRKRISKGTSTIEEVKTAQTKLQEAQNKLQEESIKLDEKLVEVLDKQIQQFASKPQEVRPDHSLILKITDEIAKIETNLSKMDKNVRGYKQLVQALERMRNNVKANGYEIINLIGQEYNEGMPFKARFVPDFNLPEGSRVISGMVKMQVNYQGVMIQEAEIVVSQNI